MKSRTLSFSAIPFLRLLIPFSGGVLLYHAYPFPLFTIIPTALIALCGLIIYFLSYKTDSEQRTRSFFVFAFFATLAAGSWNAHIHTATCSGEMYQNGFWTGEVRRIISNKNGILRCNITLQGFQDSTSDSPCVNHEEALVSFRESQNYTLKAGDLITF
ncbi:MAG: hypothetical protein ACRC9Q_02440, partial [Bacteroidales bacterium]